MKLQEDFFAGDSRRVARELLGRKLARSLDGNIYKGKITETGAYNGYVDGRKREGLTYSPGSIFLYTGQRGYTTLCVATGKKGQPSVVTIRALYPLEGIDRPVNGPAKLVEALNIDNSLDNKSIASTNLWIEGTPDENSQIKHISPESQKMAPNCSGYYRLK